MWGYCPPPPRTYTRRNGDYRKHPEANVIFDLSDFSDRKRFNVFAVSFVVIIWPTLFVILGKGHPGIERFRKQYGKMNMS